MPDLYPVSSLHPEVDMLNSSVGASHGGIYSPSCNAKCQGKYWHILGDSLIDLNEYGP